jgi:hypothetical protein
MDSIKEIITSELDEKMDLIKEIITSELDEKMSLTCNVNQFRISNKDKETCIFFTVYSDHIYLEELKKCDPFGGKKLLDLLDKIAINLKLNYIELIDDSSIVYNCSDENGDIITIRLDLLNILAYGETWYNRNGYELNRNIVNITKKDELIIEKKKSYKNMNIKFFLYLCMQEYVKNSRSVDHQFIFEEQYKLIKVFFSIYDFITENKTVGEIFINVIANLKNEKNCDKIKIIANIINDFIEPIIEYAQIEKEYNNSIYKYFIHGGKKYKIIKL